MFPTIATIATVFAVLFVAACFRTAHIESRSLTDSAYLVAWRVLG